MSKKTILIITSSFPRWPNDTDPPFVYQLANKLKNVFDITVLAPHCDGAKRRETMDGMQVIRFRYAPLKFQKLSYAGGILSNLRNTPALYLAIPFFFLFELIAMIRLIIVLQPKVIHAHWIIPQGLVAVMACRLVKFAPRILCTAHGADIHGLKGRLFEKLKQYVLRNIDVCTVVSNALRKEVRRLAGDALPIHVMPMGVDLTATFTPSSTPPISKQLLFVGRLVEKKGLGYLLEAMPRIVKEIPGATLRIIGEGHMKSTYIRFVEDNRLERSVVFQGAVNNRELPHYYQGSEILVFPSIIAQNGDQEGLGLVPVEAMGCGCGVVATDLEALKDVVQDKISGLVVPQRSSEAIAAAVLHLLQNRARLTEYRRAGRHYACRNFDWPVVAEGYQHLIEGLSDG